MTRFRKQKNVNDYSYIFLNIGEIEYIFLRNIRKFDAFEKYKEI